MGGAKQLENFCSHALTQGQQFKWADFRMGKSVRGKSQADATARL